MRAFVALLRAVCAVPLVGVVACSSSEGPDAPELVSVIEDCATAHISLKTEPKEELRFAGHTARANADGIATFDIPRARLIFAENASPFTLAVGFGKSLEYGLTQRLQLSPRIAVTGDSIPPRPALLAATARSSCGTFGSVGDEHRFPNSAEPLELSFLAWGVASAHSKHGSVTSAPGNGLRRRVTFRPDFERVLLASRFSAPQTATARVADTSGGWVDVSVTLDPRQREHDRLALLLGAAFSRYHEIETTPVPTAPAYSSTASMHPTLLFDAPRYSNATRPYLRAAALGGPGTAIEAVAFYSTGKAGESRCAVIDRRKLDLGERFEKLVLIEGRIVIREARTGKLLEQRRFRGKPHCARPGDFPSIHSSGNPEPAAHAWLAAWAGSPLEMLGEARLD